MSTLTRYPDVAVTVSTGAVLLVLSVTIGLPWPLWAVYVAIVGANIYWRTR